RRDHLPVEREALTHLRQQCGRVRLGGIERPSGPKHESEKQRSEPPLARSMTAAHSPPPHPCPASSAFTIASRALVASQPALNQSQRRNHARKSRNGERVQTISEQRRCAARSDLLRANRAHHHHRGKSHEMEHV